MAEKNRIWELDAFRGLCILGVIIVHTVFDLQMFDMITTDTPVLFNIIQNYGGLLFVVMSGICVTLGHHSFRRGSIVFACVCTGLLIAGITSRLPAQPEPTEPPKPTEPKPTEPSLPQTGQTNWPVPLLAVCGLVLIMMGGVMRSGKRDERET